MRDREKPHVLAYHLRCDLAHVDAASELYIMHASHRPETSSNFCLTALQVLDRLPS
jgi:hypothetical protein